MLDRYNEHKFLEHQDLNENSFIANVNKTVTNIDEIKKFNDYIEEGEVAKLVEAVLVGIEEAGNKWLVQLQEVALALTAAKSAFNFATLVTIPEDIASGAEIELPDLAQYIVGTHMLMVSYNGTTCYIGEQYEEIGEIGETSKKIRMLFDLRVNDKIMFRVIALNSETVLDELPVKAEGSTEYRTLEKRFGDVVSVKDFGAIGDGVADDTNAIQKALNAYGRVVIPQGTYLITDTLRIPSNTQIVGTGMPTIIMADHVPADRHVITNNQALAENRYTPNEYTTEDRIVDGVTYTLHIITTPGHCDEAAYDKNIEISGIIIDGNGHVRQRTEKGGSCIAFYGVHDCTIAQVYAINGNQHGFDINSMEETTYMLGHYYKAVGPSYNITIIDTVAINPWADDGLTTHDSHHINIIRHKSINDPTLETFTYNQNGIEIDDGSSFVNVMDCYCEGFCNGVLVTAHKFSPATHDVLVSGCRAVKCNVGFQALSLWDDVQDNDRRDNTLSRNITFLDVSIQNCEVYFPSRYLRPYAVNISGYINVKINRVDVMCNASGIPACAFNHGVADSVMDTVVYQNAPSTAGLNDNIGFIYVYPVVQQNIVVKNIHTDFATIDIVRVAATVGPISIDGVSCKNSNTGIRGVYIYASAAGIPIQINRVDVPSGAIPIAMGSTSYKAASTLHSERLSIIENSSTAREDPLISLRPKASTSTCIGVREGQFLTIGDLSGTKHLFVGSISTSPGLDNTISSGVASLRWSNVYAGTGAINTSDANEKQQVEEITDAVLDAWGEVQLRQYLFRDAFAVKGDHARIHTGVIAQQVVEAFAMHGLDASRYGLLCYDTWDDVYECDVIVDVDATYDEAGNEVAPAQTREERRKVRSAGSRYGIRYEEALVLEAAYQRRENEKLKNELTNLQIRLNVLESKLGG